MTFTNLIVILCCFIILVYSIRIIVTAYNPNGIVYVNMYSIYYIFLLSTLLFATACNSYVETMSAGGPSSSGSSSGSSSPSSSGSLITHPDTEVIKNAQEEVNNAKKEVEIAKAKVIAAQKQLLVVIEKLNKPKTGGSITGKEGEEGEELKKAEQNLQNAQTQLTTAKTKLQNAQDELFKKSGEKSVQEVEADETINVDELKEKYKKEIEEIDAELEKATGAAAGAPPAEAAPTPATSTSGATPAPTATTASGAAPPATTATSTPAPAPATTAPTPAPTPTATPSSSPSPAVATSEATEAQEKLLTLLIQKSEIIDKYIEEIKSITNKIQIGFISFAVFYNSLLVDKGKVTT